MKSKRERMLEKSIYKCEQCDGFKGGKKPTYRWRVKSKAEKTYECRSCGVIVKRED